MKRFTHFVMVGALLTLVMALVGPAAAQDTDPNTGGVIIQGNSGGDPSTFNPIIGSDTVSSDVYDLMYPDIIALNPSTLVEEPSQLGGLAESWEYDETGTVLTINLRQDLTWSDGTPITVDDWIWAADAVRSGETSSPRTYVFTTLADGSADAGFIDSYEKIDDYTLQITLGQPTRDEEGNVVELTPNCVALSDINDIAVVPSHLFEAAFGDDYAAMDDDPFFVPTATFGAFTDPFFEAGVQVSLLGAEEYQDAVEGVVNPSEFVYLSVPDTTVEYERFLAGELTFTSVNLDRQNEFREIADEAGYQVFEYPSNGYTYIGWNLADPNNPQPGLDENGEHPDQGIHPVFGDKLVRQAMAYAVDVDAIIGTRPEGDTPATGIVEGNGTRAVVHNNSDPLTWVDPGLDPYPYDPEMALSLLEEAGWVDNDGDGQLECNDCLYAREVDESYNGTPMSFNLSTNSGNTVRERIGQTVREQLGEIGITVEFEAIDFGALVDLLTSQTSDAIIIGWSLGLPFDPDGRWAFGPEADAPGSGFAFTSYYNPELYDLWEQATTIEGCNQEDRLALYQEAMQMLYEDQPYLWLFFGNVMVAAQPNVENFDPYPAAPLWNVDAWRVLSD
ncbi:hypothetical protein G4Y79_15095 [Phototrophicus methaneseepsis]|uniref:Solute-binding protein family 5 domain-containing protein n=1 Tax=Phototrophicus methaneseepsis TaxID=2710758 RepID=A0A7S8ID63_9CHLR|nr:ABC transporter substrate-binding protein [Phototrophicus methaneseepsis]QPC81029.1 hypothetical protein G4Y79_15095 [Phototrophicus methaneseepsis]